MKPRAVGPYVVIQTIRVEWTKAERGGAAAERRAAVPLAAAVLVPPVRDLAGAAGVLHSCGYEPSGPDLLSGSVAALSGAGPFSAEDVEVVVLRARDALRVRYITSSRERQRPRAPGRPAMRCAI